jgi:DNA-binding MarR family transcriptional regulator
MKQDFQERIVVGIFRLSSLLTRTGNRLAGRIDLTQQKWVLLAALEKHGECVLSQLGQSLLVTKANITGMVDRLERDGLVERRRDAADRRLWWVKLTQKGKDVLAAMNEIQAQWFERCFKDFEEAEMSEFLAQLKKLNQAVRDADGAPSQAAEVRAKTSRRNS